MFKFEIGCHRTSDEMLAAFKNLGEFSFPKVIRIQNMMPFPVVDNSNGVIMLDSNLKQDGNTQGEFSFSTFGQLIRFTDNMLTIAQLNGFERAMVLEVVAAAESDKTESDKAEDKEKPKRGRKQGEQ